MSLTLNLQQPQYALKALIGYGIQDINVHPSTEEQGAHIFFDNGAELHLAPNTEHSMIGPFLSGNSSMLRQPILRINVTTDPTIHTDSTGGEYTTLTYTFMTVMGPYSLTWHVEHDDGLEHTINHQVIFPIDGNHHVVLHDDDHHGNTIDALLTNTVTHIDTKNFGRELIITLDNALVIAATTTDEGQKRIAFLPGYVHQPMSCLNAEDIIDIHQRTCLTIPNAKKVFL